MSIKSLIISLGCLLFIADSMDASVSKNRHRSYHGADKSSCSSATLSINQSTKPIIMIDAGHGGTDEGAKVGSCIEKKIALKLSQIVKQMLELRGYQVRMTRNKDEFISLPKRVELSQVVKAKLFLSFHCNSSPNPDAHGIEIFYHDSKDGFKQKSSKRLASVALHHVLQHTGAHSRGVKRGNFHVIRETNMPAILVEIGFLTNSSEREKLKELTYLEKIAQGIASGVDRYFSY